MPHEVPKRRRKKNNAKGFHPDLRPQGGMNGGGARLTPERVDELLSMTPQEAARREMLGSAAVKGAESPKGKKKGVVKPRRDPNIYNGPVKPSEVKSPVQPKPDIDDRPGMQGVINALPPQRPSTPRPTPGVMPKRRPLQPETEMTPVPAEQPLEVVAGTGEVAAIGAEVTVEQPGLPPLAPEELSQQSPQNPGEVL